jgi:hypothetical protein
MAIADQAREFWDRISPRERRLVVIACIATPLTLAVWLGLSIHDGLDAMEGRNEKTRHALEVLADLESRGGPVAGPVDDVVATMGTEPLPLDTYLGKASQKAGFVLSSTHHRPQSTKNGFTTDGVSLDLSSISLDELKTFMQEIETQSKVTMVTHLEINRNRSKPDKLSVQMEVSTYAKEKKDDGTGSGAGGSGTPGSGGSGKGG